ncbi:MAG: endospore germination permease, partial [Firmicutes bacterium]|nr:endospore germination permease [Bacillota bacterium]
MKSNTTISNLQYFMLLLGATIPFGHFVYSHLVIAYAGRDGWISVLLFGVLALAMALMLTKLAVMQEKRSLVQHFGYIWGNWAGTIVGVLYAVYFLIIGAITIHLLGAFLGIIYPRTPREIWLLFLSIAVIWALYAGLEVLSRAVMLLLPLLMVFGVLASVLAMPDRDYAQLLPIMYHGFLPVWRGTLIMVTMVSEMVVFNMFTPDVQKRESLVRQGFIMAGLLTLLYLGPSAGPVMIFGEMVARIRAYPTIVELQYLNAQPILARLDLLGVILWVFGSFFRIATFGVGAMRAITEISQTERVNTYAIPVAIVLITLGLLMPMDRADDFTFLATTYPIISMFMGLFLPTLLLLSTWLKGLFSPKA